MIGHASKIENFNEAENQQNKIRILLLEDNPADAELIEYELSEANLSFSLKRVDTKKDFEQAIKEFVPDLILSDYDLPTYNGIQALTYVKKNCPKTPFILVTGAVTEDRAIEVLTNGARDYVLKHKLTRLIPAVKRAMEEVEEHKKRMVAEQEKEYLLKDLEKKVQDRTAELQEEIARRRRTEEALRESEEMYRISWAKLESALSSIMDAIAITDTHGNFAQLNDVFWKLYEFQSKEEFLTLTCTVDLFEAFSPDGQFISYDEWYIFKALRGECGTEQENLVHRKDIDKWWFLSFSYGPVRDKNGVITGAVVTIRNITDRKKAEEALKLTQTSVDVAAEMIAWFTSDGKILYVNDATCKHLGYSQNKLMKMSVFDFSPELTPEVFESTWNEIKAHTSLTMQTTHRRKDGSMYLSEATLNYVQYAGQEYCFAYCMDITERKRAEQELAESRQRWIATLSSIGDAVIATDKDGNINFMNAVAEKATGWLEAEVLSEPITKVFNIINEDTRQKVENPVEKILREGIIVGLANHTVLIRKDGTEVPIDDSGAPIHDQEGRTTGVVLVFRDVAEKKKAEEADRLHAELLRLSFDAIIVWSLDDGIEIWNRGAEQLYGYTQDEAKGKITHLLLRTAFPIPWPEIYKLLENHGNWEGELHHRTKDGREVIVSSRLQIIKGSDGISRILENNRDITEIKLVESQMQIKSNIDSGKEMGLPLEIKPGRSYQE